MTNAEKRGKEILGQLCKTGGWAVDQTGKIMSCALDNCAVCTFSSTRGFCLNEKQKWLNAEADEKKVFSEKDKEVLRAFDKIQWVARDESGHVFAYLDKPTKQQRCWMTLSSEMQIDVALTVFSSATFTPIKWEDDEPTSREEILGDEK